jgi:hypothetical protein
MPLETLITLLSLCLLVVYMAVGLLIFYALYVFNPEKCKDFRVRDYVGCAWLYACGWPVMIALAVRQVWQEMKAKQNAQG